jgi:hypothetical protein
VPAHSRSDPNRRSFLGAAVAAGVVVAGGGTAIAADLLKKRAAAPAPTKTMKPRAKPALTTAQENDLPGDPKWWITSQGAADAMTGYAGQASVLPGEPVQLYVSTTSRDFTVTAFRVGWYRGDLARKVWQSPTIRGLRQGAPGMTQETNTVQTDWGVSLEVPTDDWPEGSYLLRMDGDTGQRFVPVTVRSAVTAGKVVLKNSVSTWQAYNTWGGYDLYTGPTGSYNNRALVVSLDRPYDEDGANLFMVYERKLINLAEKMGLPLAYLTSMDIATDARALDGASALISQGHDEYWTPQERANVTAARDAGVNIAFLGANAMYRRVRLEPTRLGANRLVVCYKTSYMEDPLYGKDNALVTNNFRSPPDPDPESSLTGTLYEGFPTVADYVVATPDAWMFAGTGVRKGSSFPNMVGIEYDRVNPCYPVERPIQVLSHSPVTCNGVNSYSDSAYYTHASGAGVFNSGTMRWVETFAVPFYHWGLTSACGDMTRQVTANVLRAFSEGPAADKYPAQDNLDDMHEWAGDPLAAGRNLWPPVFL